MIRAATSLLTLAIFSMVLIAAPPVIPVFAAGGGGGGEPPPSSSPPPSDTKSTHKARKKTSKQSGLDDPAFIRGYRAAYATIYERNDYAGAIGQLKALGHDDSAKKRPQWFHPVVMAVSGFRCLRSALYCRPWSRARPCQRSRWSGR
jgi:hypothetical protein